MDTRQSEIQQSKQLAEREADIALIKRIAVKDAAAFNLFCQKHFAALHHFLSRVVRSVDTIEELINDAFFVVWQKADTFKFQSAPKTWLFGIAYNKALKAVDKFARAPETTDLDESLEAANSCPTHLSVQQQTSEEIQRALYALSPEHRAVMELTFYHGYSYSEIGEIIGCPSNTVKTRMFHARKLLKGHLTAKTQRGEI